MAAEAGLKLPSPLMKHSGPVVPPVRYCRCGDTLERHLGARYHKSPRPAEGGACAVCDCKMYAEIRVLRQRDKRIAVHLGPENVQYVRIVETFDTEYGMHDTVSDAVREVIRKGGR